MKFISVKSVVEAYKGFQDCMTNKSWGIFGSIERMQEQYLPLRTL